MVRHSNLHNIIPRFCLVMPSYMFQFSNKIFSFQEISATPFQRLDSIITRGRRGNYFAEMILSVTEAQTSLKNNTSVCNLRKPFLL